MAARKTTAKKSAPKKKAVITDLNSQADTQATPGSFVSVAEGEHEGRYGALVEIDGETAIVRTRDDFNERLVVPYDSLRPARSGQR